MSGAAQSLRRYARHRGTSPASVCRAIKAGILSASVTRDARGVPKIADVALADREWPVRADLSPIVETLSPRSVAVPAVVAIPSVVSLREYARHRRTSVTTVARAVKSGRLRRSVVRDERGAPKIVDVVLADKEWADYDVIGAAVNRVLQVTARNVRREVVREALAELERGRAD